MINCFLQISAEPFNPIDDIDVLLYFDICCSFFIIRKINDNKNQIQNPHDLNKKITISKQTKCSLSTL